MQEKRYSELYALLISISLVLCSFIWQGNVGFNLWDEGFLWYGVQRVILGEIPVRDFMAYDPGRYYWSAGIMNLMGDNGIMSLRIAVAVFQAFGLFVGLLLISKTIAKRKEHLLYLLLSGITLLIWMFPRHKLFDISLSIFLVGILSYLVEKPNYWRHFFAGCVIGLTAFFGRNHGLYGVLGYIGVIFLMPNERLFSLETIKKVFTWGCGVIAGYSPMFLLMLFVPGFADANLENLLLPIQQGVTNLPLPVPWPWLVDFSSGSMGDIARGLLVGLFFIALLVFGLLSIAWLVFRKFKRLDEAPIFIATACMVLPYAHYAFSRADIGHLAQGIFPFLLGCFILFSRLPSRVNMLVSVGLCAASLWVMYIFHPGWFCLASRTCTEVDISGSLLKVDPGTASDIALLHTLVDEYAPSGESFIVTPFWPGAYPIFDRKSPMLDVYAIWPRSASYEEREIERIKAAQPVFVFVFDLPLDGRDELRFQNTHPLIYQYILDNFELLPDSPNPQYQIYIASEPK